jgi:hypothetical protein
MPEGVIGLGTRLKIGDGATPEVFTAIAEVKDITGPRLTREFAEFRLNFMLCFHATCPQPDARRRYRQSGSG